jgi:transposase
MRIQCTVYLHDKRALIDVGLVNGVSCPVLAKRYGLGAKAVYRHAKNHLPPQVRAAILTSQRPSAVDLEALAARVRVCSAARQAPAT